jgi:two-component system NtrC family sensor kinase
MRLLLIAVGLLVPGLLFVGAAWKSRADILREGEATTLSVVAVLGDTLRDQLQTEQLALATVADHLRGLSWDDIARPETSDFLVELKASLDQLGTIFIAHRDGTIRAASEARMLGSRIAAQEFFKIDRNGDVYVGAAFTGQSTQPISLDVVRRRTAPDGRFDGTIHAELDPGYLVHLFTQATPIAHDVMLIGPDGEILDGPSRQRGLRQLRSDNLLMRHITAQPLGGSFSGPSILGGQNEELYSYKSVPGYPVWVGLAVDRAALLRRWYGSLQGYGAAAAAGALTLIIASSVVIRRARAEQGALAQLHAETERRLHTEQRLHQAHRLETVGRLAAGVAHDFNNLLTVVVGSLELIGRAAGLNERIQALVSQATRAAERGARLTSSLLAFTRQQIVQTDTLNVNLLISELLPELKQSMGDTIGLELRLQPDLRPCRADAAQFEAALLNVAINARDAMQERGTLTITTRHEELDHAGLADNPDAEPGAFIAVSLTDTGSGMSREVLAKAFEPFFTTKEVGKGSGLGLSQVLGFVRQVGGHVIIESAQGRGSVVTLFLPQA